MAYSEGDAVQATPQPIEPSPQAIPASAVPAPGITTVPQSNLAVGIAMGTLFGLVAAILYAVIAIVSEREFVMLALLIGFGIAFGFSRFGHTRGIVPGVIAAVIALVLFFVAIFVEGAGSIAKFYDASFIDGLRAVTESPGEFLSIYFSDKLSYVFLALTVGFAFYYANGGKAAKAEKAALAQQQGAVTNESLIATQNDSLNDSLNATQNATQNETPNGA